MVNANVGMCDKMTEQEKRPLPLELMVKEPTSVNSQKFKYCMDTCR